VNFILSLLGSLINVEIVGFLQIIVVVLQISKICIMTQSMLATVDQWIQGTNYLFMSSKIIFHARKIIGG